MFAVKMNRRKRIERERVIAQKKYGQQADVLPLLVLPYYAPITFLGRTGTWLPDHNTISTILNFSHHNISAYLLPISFASVSFTLSLSLSLLVDDPVGLKIGVMCAYLNDNSMK